MAPQWPARLRRNLPLLTAHAMLTGQKNRERPPLASRIPALEPGIGWDLSEIFNMRSKYFLGLLCAAAMSVALSGTASAQTKTVKIGGIYPLSGNAASAGVHAKAAIETALDIINNTHPELGNLPLAQNAGLAGLGGAKVEVV